MLVFTEKDLSDILRDYRIPHPVISHTILLHQNCDITEQKDKQLKLIIRVDLAEHTPVVVKFRGGCDERHRLHIIEEQTVFSNIIRENGIITPKYYMANSSFATEYNFYGFQGVVTVEDYCENEIKLVDKHISYLTGELLAQTHTISERNQCHIYSNKIIFDPLTENDLYDYDEFKNTQDKLDQQELTLFSAICSEFDKKFKSIEPLRNCPRYAVQGDVSLCNTYLTEEGKIGLFDFNCSGDSVLFFDAVMQGWFVAHLMDYAQPMDDAGANELAKAFLEGYSKIRPFTDTEKDLAKILYTIISALDCRIIYYEGGLLDAIEKKDHDLIYQILEKIHNIITSDTIMAT